MRPLFVAVLLICFAAQAPAAETRTALSALKVLPKGDAKRVARIQAFEGKPAPVRWHILVHDPAAENGLREYVVAGGEVVASREVSQFAEGLKPEDVIGGALVKIDSDKVGRLAQQFALANDVAVESLNYELLKDGMEAAPVWRVTCLDESGKQLAMLVVTASKGTVISHDGFALTPPPPDTRKPKFKPETRPQVATREATIDRARPGIERYPEDDYLLEPSYDEPRSDSRGRRVTSRERREPTYPPPSPFSPVRRIIRRVLPF